MKNNRIKFCFVLVLLLTLLSACSNSASTVLEMELTQNHDTSEPFINEKLIYVSDNAGDLKLEVSFQMEGETGILEIEDNKTKQTLFSNTWNGNVESTTFTIPLDEPEKEKEYVIRFTGTEIKHTKIVITSNSNLVKERERLEKPTRD